MTATGNLSWYQQVWREVIFVEAEERSKKGSE